MVVVLLVMMMPVLLLLLLLEMLWRLRAALLLLLALQLAQRTTQRIDFALIEILLFFDVLQHLQHLFHFLKRFPQRADNLIDLLDRFGHRFDPLRPLVRRLWRRLLILLPRTILPSLFAMLTAAVLTVVALLALWTVVPLLRLFALFLASAFRRSLLGWRCFSRRIGWLGNRDGFADFCAHLFGGCLGQLFGIARRNFTGWFVNFLGRRNFFRKLFRRNLLVHWFNGSLVLKFWLRFTRSFALWRAF
jgi:hypothetical protein